jgi:hypothetical protein
VLSSAVSVGEDITSYNALTRSADDVIFERGAVG